MKKKLWQLGLTLMTTGFASCIVLFAASVIATACWTGNGSFAPADSLPGLFGIDAGIMFAIALVVMVAGLLICLVQITKEFEAENAKAADPTE